MLRSEPITPAESARARKCDECSTVGDFDQAVLGQRFDGFPIELAQGTLGLCNETQRPRAALAERAFETRLLAQRLVAPASGRTRRRERADSAARNARQAHRCNRDP